MNIRLSVSSRRALRGPLFWTLAGSVGLSLLTGPLRAGVELSDDFASFTLGETWQAFGAGAPDLALAVVSGIGADGSSLRLGTAPGSVEDVLGLETRTPIALVGATRLRVTARVRPLNQTAAGDGGASKSSAGVVIIGAENSFVRASAGANRPTAPDWGDFYGDSEGSADTEAAFVHFPPNDPAGGAEAFRTFVLEISAEGTRLTTLSSSGQPLAVSPFDVFNPNLTLESFGSSVTIALFQQRSDSTLSPENTFGDFDSVVVETTRAIDDTDGDGMPNVYEAANGLNPAVNDAGLDLDGDGLTNLMEYQRGTAANNPDTDGDGLKDGVETGTGLYVSSSDTGTSPFKADSDNDGLSDSAETGTGVFLSAANTGTDPNRPDSDGDGFNDGLEAGAGFDPNSSGSTPDGFTTIRTAVEVTFFAAPGVSYRIEGSLDLQSWTLVEGFITGAGQRVTRLYSTENLRYRYFRVVPN